MLLVDKIQKFEENKGHRPISKVLFNQSGELIATYCLNGDLDLFKISNTVEEKTPLSSFQKELFKATRSVENSYSIIKFETLRVRRKVGGSIKDFFFTEESQHIVFIDRSTLFIEKVFCDDRLTDPSSVLELKQEVGLEATFTGLQQISNKEALVLVTFHDSKKGKFNTKAYKLELARVLKDCRVAYESQELLGVSSLRIKDEHNLPSFWDYANFQFEIPEFSLNACAITVEGAVLCGSDDGELCVAYLPTEEAAKNSFYLLRKKITDKRIKNIHNIRKTSFFTVTSKSKKVLLYSFADKKLQKWKKFVAPYPIHAACVDESKRWLVCVGGQEASLVASVGASVNFHILVYSIYSGKCVFKINSNFFSPVNTIDIATNSKNQERKDGSVKDVLIAAGSDTGAITILEINKEVFKGVIYIEEMHERVEKEFSQLCTRENI